MNFAAPRAVVPPRELLDDHVADVVAVARVLAARVAEPDDEQVERRGAFAPSPGQAHGELLLGFGLVAAAASAAALGLAASASAPSAASSAPSSASSTALPRGRAGRSRCTVSSGSSRSVTPSGTSSLREPQRVADRRAPRRRPRAALRNLERQRLDVDLVRDLRQDAALAHADRVADERDRDRRLDRLVEPDLLEVDVRDRAAHLVALVVLEDRRVGRAAVDRRRRARRATRPRVVSAARRSRSPIAIATGSERP